MAPRDFSLKDLAALPKAEVHIYMVAGTEVHMYTWRAVGYAYTYYGCTSQGCTYYGCTSHDCTYRVRRLAALVCISPPSYTYGGQYIREGGAYMNAVLAVKPVMASRICMHIYIRSRGGVGKEPVAK